jgi:hypothetical protein
MVTYGFLSTRKTLTAASAQSVKFAQSELPQKDPVAAFHLSITGTGNDLDDLDRIRIKRDSVIHVDVSVDQLLALIARYTRRSIVKTATRLTIPLYRPTSADQVDAEEYRMGLAPGNLEVEVVTKSSVAAGDLGIAWTLLDSRPDAQPVILPVSLAAVGAGSQNQRVTVDPPGLLAAFALPDPANLSKVQAWVNGAKICEIPAQDLRESQALLGSAETDPFVLRLEPPRAGKLELVLDTTASWAPAGKELIYYAGVPVPA